MIAFVKSEVYGLQILSLSISNGLPRQELLFQKSLLRSGSLDATSSMLNSLFQGFLYAFIFYQYYRDYLDPENSNLSVGSILVIYFAVGSLSSSLNSVSEDLVSIAQSLPTYWMPNAIRDIDVFRSVRSPQRLTCPNSIVLSQLTYAFDGTGYPFKKPISLSLQINNSYALIGPSGSGKSTLLRLLVRHLNPKSGSVELFDDNYQKLNYSLADCRILLLTQDANFCGSRLYDVVDPSRTIPIQKIEKACHQLDLSELLDSLPLRWQTPINEFSRDLSLGQLQRFKIARALLDDYDIILSDEATCHLSEEQHLKMIKLLNQHSKIHISVLHRISALNYFDEVIKINRAGEISTTSVTSLSS